MNTGDRNRQLAIHHATVLQNRKDIETVILENLEELIDYPTSPNATASNPSDGDVTRFRSLIAPFQVTDYDALIEERNADGKCGYVLCPRPFRQERNPNAKFRILWGNAGGQDLKTVPRNKVEKWCSRECAKRSLFVKIQLSEVPAWQRPQGAATKVELLTEGVEAALGEKMSGVSHQDSEEDRLREAMAQLALERNETENSARAASVMRGTLHESSDIGAVTEPQTAIGDSHREIEGYTPRSEGKNVNRESDWDIE